MTVTDPAGEKGNFLSQGEKGSVSHAQVADATLGKEGKGTSKFPSGPEAQEKSSMMSFLVGSRECTQL